MEILIALMVVVGLYFVIPCSLKDLYNHDNDKVDGGVFGKAPKPVKRKYTRKTSKVVKPKKKQIKRKVVKKKRTKK